MNPTQPANPAQPLDGLPAEPAHRIGFTVTGTTEADLNAEAMKVIVSYFEHGPVDFQIEAAATEMRNGHAEVVMRFFVGHVTAWRVR